jgi:type I restriction enzyme, S subunit
MGAIKPENCNYKFLYTLLEKADLGHSFSGSTIPHIYFKDYGENNYLIPDKKEQEQIGNLFDNLDTLITLHQRE